MSGFTLHRFSASRGKGRNLGHRLAFTLVELLVSLAILVLIMATVASIVSETGTLWHQTVSRVQEFREARDAFEAITRRLSQATLNTYWDYAYGNPAQPTQPTSYIRQSELRFISLSGSLTLNGASAPANVSRPTHAIFFQAPLGFVAPDATTSGTSYRGMENLLNTWGYYVEYNSDQYLRPTFVTSPPRTRFRLMELMQSSQDLNLYAQEQLATGAATGNASYVYTNMQPPQSAWGWFIGTSTKNYADGINGGLNQITATTAPVHVLAENVLALVILPKLTAATEKSGTNNYTDASLAPGYTYDSTGTNGVYTSVGGSTSFPPASFPDPNLNPTNQLPPVVSVTMVAIDETTAIRLTPTQNQAILTELSSLFTNSANYSSDLTGVLTSTSVGGTPAGGGLEPFLQGMNINYRVFTTEVSIRAAKWSTDQSN